MAGFRYKVEVRRNGPDHAPWAVTLVEFTPRPRTGVTFDRRPLYRAHCTSFDSVKWVVNLYLQTHTFIGYPVIREVR